MPTPRTHPCRPPPPVQGSQSSFRGSHVHLRHRQSVGAERLRRLRCHPGVLRHGPRKRTKVREHGMPATKLCTAGPERSGNNAALHRSFVSRIQRASKPQARLLAFNPSQLWLDRGPSPQGRGFCRILLGSSRSAWQAFRTKRPWCGRAAADSGADQNSRRPASSAAPEGTQRRGCSALVEFFPLPPPLTIPWPRGLEYHSFRTRLA